MKKLIHTLLLFISSSISAQNLVPLGGFEFEDSCTVSGFQANVPPLYPYNRIFPFYAPTDGSPDIFKDCDLCGVYCSPSNQFGIQPPHLGSQYAGFDLMLYNAGTMLIDYREYITVKLSDTLQKGWYCFNVYWSLADNSGLAIDGLGVYFHPDSVNISNNGLNYRLLPFTPQIENLPGNVLSDKNGWTEFSGYFKANGNERYLTIGNFKPDSILTVDTLDNYGSQWYDVYYYIDDISLYKCDSLVGVNENLYKAPTVYPNPNNGEVFVALPKEITRATIQVFNSLGVFLQSAIATAAITELNLNPYTNGLYIIRIFDSNGKEIENKKISLQR